jgi:DNA-binding NarL/FixJ family response regulator
LRRAARLPARAWRAAASIVAIGVTLSGVATILLAGVDLYIRGKLEAALTRHHLVTTDSVEPPDVVVADVARMDPEEIADAYPDVPLLGFTNHSDTAGLRAAHEAGFDQVVAKSALSERAAELIEELLPSLE